MPARHRVPPGQQVAQAGERLQPLLDGDVEEARRQGERRHPLARDRRVDVAERERPGRQQGQAAAVDEGPPDLQRRGVERQRRELQEHLPGAEGHEAALADQPHHRAMADGDPLGPPRRARGVQHVGQGLGRRLVPGAVRGFRLPGLEVLKRQARRRRGERREQPERADHRRRRRIREQEPQALAGMGGVERQVGGARLQDAEERRHHLPGALRAQPDEGAAADPQPPQPAGDATGPPVELAVGEPPLVPRYRHRLRPRRRLLFEQVVHGAAPGVRGGVVPLRRQLVALGRGQQRQAGERQLRGRRRAAEERRVMGEEARRGRRGEEVRRVLGLEPERRPRELCLLDRDCQVELRRRPLGPRQPREAQPLGDRPGGRRPAVALQRQQHLDEGAARQVALRPQRLDQRFERQVLVGEGAERRLARRGEQGAEVGVAVEPRPQRQRVDEEPDEPLGLRPRAVRHRCADQQVLPAGVAREERREAGEEQHVEGRPFPPRRPAQPRRRRCREEQPAARPAEALHRRPRTVGRQLERRRRAGQPLPPVGELALQHLRRPGALPAGVVGVLHRQLAERRRPPRHGRGVESRQLREQHPLRPAVVDGVVERDEERVLLAPQPH
jgi:hypothetical protein